MLQVDFFVTMTLGSSFAIAASEQLKREDKPFQNKYYFKVLLFLSFLFIPAVTYLIVQFPGWETMFVLHQYLTDLDSVNRGSVIVPPAAGFIVVAHILSTLSTGTFGFYVAFKLIKKDRIKGALIFCLTMLAVGIFVQVYGWDGTALERFLFTGSAYDWHQWKVLGLENKYPVSLSLFITSRIFYTLVVIFGILLPIIGFIWLKWHREGKNL